MNIKERYEFNPEQNLLSKRAGVSTYISQDKLLQRPICLRIFQVGKDESDMLTEAAKKAILYFHPNLCSYYDTLEQSNTDAFGITHNSIVVVSEFIEGGALKQSMPSFDTKEEQLKLLTGILKGLQYLHEHNTYHLNLHPGNIFIKNSNDEKTPKIADYLPLNVNAKSIISQFDAQNTCYKAPELFKETTESELLKKADFWSFGVIMYELISGKPLFFDASKRMEQIIQCIAFERIDFTVISDLHLRSVLEKILQRNAKHRPESAAEIIELLHNPSVENIAVQQVAPVNNAILIPVIEKLDIKPIVHQTQAETVIDKEEKSVLLGAPFIEEPQQEVEVAKTEQSSLTLFFKKASLPILGSLLLMIFSLALFFSTDSTNKEVATNAFDKNTEQEKIASSLSDRGDSLSQKTDSATALSLNTIATPTYTTKISPSTVLGATIVRPETTVTAVTNVAPLVTESLYLPAIDMVYEQVYPIDLGNKYHSVNPATLECLYQRAQIKEIGRNLFLVKPSETGPITLVFKDKLTNQTIDSRTYNVSTRPDPKAYVGNDLRNTNAPKNLILAKQGLQLVSPQDPSIRITSFRMRIDNADIPFESTSNSSLFQQEMMDKIRDAKPGQKIVFDRIRAADSKGSTLNVNEIYVTVSPY